MADAPEELAIVALRDVLAAGLAEPPTGDWDYVHAPTVRRGPLPPVGQQMKADECPVLYVVAGQGSQLNPIAVDGKRERIAYRYDLHVDLHGCVFREPTDPILADTDRWRFRSHVADVLHAHRHLGGISRDGIRFGDRPEAVDNGEIAPNAWFVLPITIPLAQSFSTVPA
jgi:hypothetical protein